MTHLILKKMSNTYWNNDKTSKINMPTKYKKYKTGSVNNANILYLHLLTFQTPFIYKKIEMLL